MTSFRSLALRSLTTAALLLLLPRCDSQSGEGEAATTSSTATGGVESSVTSGGTTSTASGGTSAIGEAGASGGASSAGGTSSNGGSGSSSQEEASAGGSTSGSLGGAGSGGAEPVERLGKGGVCSGDSFAPLDGYLDIGPLCGHVWTFAPGADQVVPPCDGGECFVGNELCVAGSLPASDPDNGTFPFITLGWNIQQELDDSEGDWTSQGSGLTVSFNKGSFQGEVRLEIAAELSKYCVTVESEKRLQWSDLRDGCGTEGGESMLAGTEFRALRLQLFSTLQAHEFEGFCLKDIIVHP